MTALRDAPIRRRMSQQLDGVLQLDATEQELVHEQFEVDTADHEDHTFCGVMFTIECHTELPAEYLEVQSVWVRGALGPMTCWVTRKDVEDVMEKPSEWTRVYEAEHSASPVALTELKLVESIRLLRGERCGLYVHSGLQGDEGLVYDNQRGDVTYHDKVLKVLPGLAHISNRPFGTRGMWWGSAWRSNRAFVGRLAYGVRWRRWSPAPEVHHAFPRGFRETVITLLAGSRRPESLLYLLQDEVIFFLMNKVCISSEDEEPHS